MADTIERFEEAQKLHKDTSEKQKTCKKKLETFGETMKRKSIENDEKQSTSKRRNTGSETLTFLQRKA